jgi:hypothetical protein
MAVRPWRVERRVRLGLADLGILCTGSGAQVSKISVGDRDRAERGRVMTWTLRRFQIVTATTVAAPWMVFWAVAVVAFGQPLNPVLVVYSTAPWVGGALLVLNRWWSRTGYGPSTLDAPGALLVAAVAALPERRRMWGMAMLAELAEVRGGRPAGGSPGAVPGPRCSCDRPAGWPVLALVTGTVLAAAASWLQYQASAWLCWS